MTDQRDYSATLFLPQTDFPMRAGLPQKEPELLARWAELNIYRRLREAAQGRTKFILHDGPPYANGNIHIGTALNKVLKDVVTRSQQMLGYDSNYVPGWDCHGLPIEWKIEEERRAKGWDKFDVTAQGRNAAASPMISFRAECRAFAQHWLEVQRDEFKRLGVEGDWDGRYATMDFFAEATIARELMKFAANGTLYRGSKPVMWSVVEQTALAEAEVEYEDYTSDTVWVKFPIADFNPPYYRTGVDFRRSVSTGALEAYPGGPSTDASLQSEQERLKLWDDLFDASIVIWTTTPWTIPGNRAISYSEKIPYGLYQVTDAPEGNWAKASHKFVLADKLAEDVMRQAKVVGFEKLREVSANELASIVAAHPLKTMGYDFDVPLLEGDHVTDDAGTGFVHTAPGHGREDFDIWTANARELEARGINTAIPYTVDENGAFTEAAPGFTGKRVLNDKGEKGDANDAVIKALAEAGMLIARGRLKHQYPHSWRSKKPVIFRNTPQWFIAMDKVIATAPPAHSAPPPPLRGRSTSEASREGGTKQGAVQVSTPLPNPPPRGSRMFPTSATIDWPTSETSDVGWGRERATASGQAAGDTLRNRALTAIKETRWVPPAGENRITGMIESRPDWVISRQRAWGVPITVFIKERGDGSVDVLQDEAVNARIVEAFEQEGADAWYAEGGRERFLGSRASEGWQKVDDILDVWFDSGSTHAFTLEDPRHFPSLVGIKRKRDGGGDTVMYLEGSDQHRGWFQSSLLESCGTRGHAPFDVVLTHGFVLAEDGRKMSKSLGNTVAPQDVIKQSGADILRMWVCASDYADDIRIGKEILKTTVDTYRKLRNTIRWMLGNLAHFREQDRVDVARMPELERLMLHRLGELDATIREAYAAFDYKRIFATLNAFMTVDLSAFYFDIRKDALYCEPVSSVTRKACLTVLDQLFRCTVTWLAPMLCFTAEEAWLARYPSEEGSVHLEPFPDVPAEWRNDALAEKWRKVRLVRRVITGALEIERAGKRIGSSLEAAPVVYVSNPDLFTSLVDVDLAEVGITSAATLAEGEGPADAFRLDEVRGVAVVPGLAEGTKCARSWKISPAVGSDPQYPDVTPRDAQAMREWDAVQKAAE